MFLDVFGEYVLSGKRTADVMRLDNGNVIYMYLTKSSLFRKRPKISEISY